jgi:hypothetical protein
VVTVGVWCYATGTNHHLALVAGCECEPYCCIKRGYGQIQVLQKEKNRGVEENVSLKHRFGGKELKSHFTEFLSFSMVEFLDVFYYCETTKCTYTKQCNPKSHSYTFKREIFVHKTSTTCLQSAILHCNITVYKLHTPCN